MVVLIYLISWKTFVNLRFYKLILQKEPSVPLMYNLCFKYNITKED